MTNQNPITAVEWLVNELELDSNHPLIKKVDTTKLDEESVRSVDQYFKHTTLSVDDIDKFLDCNGHYI